VLQDLEKRSEHVMQMVNELPFADYKGFLPAPHTLPDLKQSLDRGEVQSFLDVRLPIMHFRFVFTNVLPSGRSSSRRWSMCGSMCSVTIPRTPPPTKSQQT
jgi:hypothetical protein